MVGRHLPDGILTRCQMCTSWRTENSIAFWLSTRGLCQPKFPNQKTRIAAEPRESRPKKSATGRTSCRRDQKRLFTHQESPRIYWTQNERSLPKRTAHAAGVGANSGKPLNGQHNAPSERPRRTRHPTPTVAAFCRIHHGRVAQAITRIQPISRGKQG